MNNEFALLALDEKHKQLFVVNNQCFASAMMANNKNAFIRLHVFTFRYV